MELLVKKFSDGKYEDESELFAEPISEETVKLIGEMIALQSLRIKNELPQKTYRKLLSCRLLLYNF